MAQALDLTFIWRDTTVRARVITAFALAYNYQANIPDPADSTKTIPNPITATQFFENQLLRYVRDVVVAQEAQAAGVVANTSKQSEVTIDLDIKV